MAAPLTDECMSPINFDYMWARLPLRNNYHLESSEVWWARNDTALRNGIIELNKLRVKAGETPLEVTDIISTDPKWSKEQNKNLSWTRLMNEANRFPLPIPIPSWVREDARAAAHIQKERESRGLNPFVFTSTKPTQSELISAYEDTHNSENWNFAPATGKTDLQESAYAKNFALPLWATKPVKQHGESVAEYTGRLTKRLEDVDFILWSFRNYLGTQPILQSWDEPYTVLCWAQMYNMHFEMDFDAAYSMCKSFEPNSQEKKKKQRAVDLRYNRKMKHAEIFTGESSKFNSDPDSEDLGDVHWWKENTPRDPYFLLPSYDPTIHTQVLPGKDGPGNVRFGDAEHDDLSNPDTQQLLADTEADLSGKEKKDFTEDEKTNYEWMLKMIRWRDTEEGWQRLKVYGITPFMDNKDYYNNGTAPLLFEISVPRAAATPGQQVKMVKEWWKPDEERQERNIIAQNWDVKTESWKTTLPQEKLQSFMEKTPTADADVHDKGLLRYGYGALSYSDVSPIRSLPWANNSKVLTDDAPQWKAPPEIIAFLENADISAADEKRWPQALGYITQPIPRDDWGDDLFGQEELKRKFKINILLPQKNPQLYVGVVKPSRNTLLYGPPGTGKTMIAKRVAAQAGALFAYIKPSNIIGGYVSTPATLIELLYKALQKYNKPAVVFFDECENLIKKRGLDKNQMTDGIVTALLTWTEENAVTAPIYTIFASNIPQNIDPAILDRIKIRIPVWLPGKIERRRNFEYQFKRAVDQGVAENAILAQAFINQVTEASTYMSFRAIDAALKDVWKVELTVFVETTPKQKIEWTDVPPVSKAAVLQAIKDTPSSKAACDELIAWAKESGTDMNKYLPLEYKY
jgi:hypothetical protein